MIISELYIVIDCSLSNTDSWSVSGLKASGSDDPDNLGYLGHFLVGQVGLIHKLNHLDVTWIPHACSLGMV